MIRRPAPVAANYERIKTQAGRLSMLASYAAVGTYCLQTGPLAALRPLG
jgi:hypothetical protein